MEKDLTNREDAFSFWKNLILITVFFSITPLVLFVSLFSLISLKRVTPTEEISISPTSMVYSPQSGVRIFASLPVSLPSVDGTIIPSDARSEIIKQYMTSYNSPLTPHSALIISMADKYGLDYRLLVAIAQQESNLCKIIPPGSNNCWGWGIHSEGNLGFVSYEEAIETVSKGLKEEYFDKGFITVEQIMSKYTPLSNGSWAFGVNKFMNEMQ